MRLRPGDEIDIDVDSVASEGRGVGRVDDFVVFVGGAFAGERVRARIERVKRNHAEARGVEVLRASAHRVPGRCQHLGECGGCILQRLDYPAQLDVKTQFVRDALERIGGFRNVDVPRAVASPEPYFYRNKMEFSFYAGRNGEVVLGLHTPGRFDHVFDLQACWLMSETSNRIVARVRELAVRSGLPAYHNRQHRGFWRFLVVREGKNTGQTMINLVTHAGAIANQDELVRTLVEEFPAVTSLVRTIHTGRATIAVGEREEVLHGVPEIEERIGDLRFRIGSNTFFQTNSGQAEHLFRMAVQGAQLDGQQEVLDLYAGTGAISLFLAQRARRVTGIELVPESVRMAERNARLNGIDNCRFFTGEVRDFLRLRAAEAAAADVVVADPPRAGLHPDIVQALRVLQPRRVVYVSCNPATLARDLGLLCADGLYALESIHPIDMFPHTVHVESVAVLERRD